MTKIFTFLVGQSCRSAPNSRAAQQRRPTKDAKIFVLRPFLFSVLSVFSCSKLFVGRLVLAGFLPPLRWVVSS